MKKGDFVDIHFGGDIGCKIARLVSDDGETVTAKFDYNIIVENIPKERCTLYLSINDNYD